MARVSLAAQLSAMTERANVAELRVRELEAALAESMQRAVVRNSRGFQLSPLKAACKSIALAYGAAGRVRGENVELYSKKRGEWRVIPADVVAQHLPA